MYKNTVSQNYHMQEFRQGLFVLMRGFQGFLMIQIFINSLFCQWMTQ